MSLAQIIDNKPVEVSGPSVLHNNTQSSVASVNMWSDAERLAAGIHTIMEPPLNPSLTVTGTSLSVVDGAVVRTVTTVARIIQKEEVDFERDRRMQAYTFSGKQFDFDSDSQTNISGAGTLALAAIINGAQPGNLRWANPATDFVWIAADNSTMTMDAQTCFAFAQAAAQWKASHIVAARTIKDMNPIPADYTADARWPS